MPGEVRLWSETFGSENPELLEWAFREYLKTAKFFPKPGDITDFIAERRGSLVAHKDWQPEHAREETAAHQSSPEWVGSSKAARAALRRLAASRPGVTVEHKSVPPALQLTSEQIAERREKEQKEIRKVVEGA